MKSIRVCLAVAISLAPNLLFADAFSVIIRGKVTMLDGSAPGKSIGIERYCTDGQGSAPGPITNKQGEYTWRLDVDPFKQRRCYLQATSRDYNSTRVEISALNGVEKTVTLPDIVLSDKIADPYTIVTGGFSIPGKSKDSFNAGIKAVDEGNSAAAVKQLRQAVADSPKFAAGWHILGLMEETQGNYKQAREAYEHAIENDPKNLPANVTLAKACLRLKDYECTLKSADNLLKIDTKHVYPQIFIHQAAAKLAMKDLAGAEAAAKEAIRPDLKAKIQRANYVLARIAAEKGDVNAAREYVNAYAKADPMATDMNQIKAWAAALGTPAAEGTAPEI